MGELKGELARAVAVGVLAGEGEDGVAKAAVVADVGDEADAVTAGAGGLVEGGGQGWGDLEGHVLVGLLVGEAELAGVIVAVGDVVEGENARGGFMRFFG